MLPLSLVIPVRDGAKFLRQTLPTLVASLPPDSEVIVCDDASTDTPETVAGPLGARVVRLDTASGPAAARNAGARAARHDTLVFLDADVRVHTDTLHRLVAPLADSTVAAAFGSYDSAPPEQAWVSLYKNLAHHFVHQRSDPEATTFWAGCGAVRRDAFERLGGFDERYRRPSIEDVDLGQRLCLAGYRVRLVREAQVMHLKRWTLLSWLASDLRDRAIPWGRLLRSGRQLPRDLNFRVVDRLASALVAIAWGSAAAAWLDPRLLAVVAACAAAAIALDAPFLAFAASTVSLPFAAACAPLHLLHRTVGLMGLALGLVARPREPLSLARPPEPGV
jgi:GT2 family glycosyltransferase